MNNRFIFKKWIYVILLCFLGMGGSLWWGKHAGFSEPAQPSAPRLAAANNQFALDIYAKYQGKKGNLFFSPYSLLSALTMVYEGARGKTADEMASVLHLPRDPAQIRNDFLQLDRTFREQKRPYQLTVANALWIQKEYPFHRAYFDLIKQYYGGKITALDFRFEGEKARRTINQWIEARTNHKIKNLIPEGMLNLLTRLILTNAIYFKADWEQQFEPEITKAQPFKLESGKTVQVKMMQQTSYFRYGETDRLQFLEMPYVGKDLAMFIILPKDHRLKMTEADLSLKHLEAWQREMKEEEVRVSLPRFKFETKNFLANDLKEMGMTTPFRAFRADFGGMSASKELFVNEVIHQAFIDVTEAGTEAAAATAIMMSAGSAQVTKPPPKLFMADHPFLFMIRENRSGTILFLGRLSDPT